MGNLFLPVIDLLTTEGVASEFKLGYGQIVDWVDIILHILVVFGVEEDH